MLVKIRIDYAGLSSSSEGSNLEGVIYVEFDSYAFPENNWFDWVGMALSEWIGAFNDFQAGKTESFQFCFPEGDGLWVEFTADGPGKLLARCYSNIIKVDFEEFEQSKVPLPPLDQRKPKLLCEERVDVSNVADELSAVVNLLLSECERRQISDPELSYLRQNQTFSKH